MLVGIVLIILGVAALAYHGITYTTHEKVLKIGPIEATKETEKTIPLPPLLGGSRACSRDCVDHHGSKKVRWKVSELIPLNAGDANVVMDSFVLGDRYHCRDFRILSNRSTGCMDRQSAFRLVFYLLCSFADLRKKTPPV